MTTEDELSGLLNLALVGLRHLQKEGGFASVPVAHIQNLYETHSDTVKALIQARCVLYPQSKTLTGYLFLAYNVFVADL